MAYRRTDGQTERRVQRLYDSLGRRHNKVLNKNNLGSFWVWFDVNRCSLLFTKNCAKKRLHVFVFYDTDYLLTSNLLPSSLWRGQSSTRKFELSTTHQFRVNGWHGTLLVYLILRITSSQSSPLPSPSITPSVFHSRLKTHLFHILSFIVIPDCLHGS